MVKEYTGYQHLLVGIDFFIILIFEENYIFQKTKILSF